MEKLRFISERNSSILNYLGMYLSGLIERTILDSAGSTSIATIAAILPRHFVPYFLGKPLFVMRIWMPASLS